MRHFPLVLLTLAACPGVAWAGMPSFRLSDVVRLRLENLSFFLFGFLLSALLIQLVWNYLARDWAALPRLNYPKALGLVTLWGLFFVLVLTMISGARELMTPAAWEPNGLTHKLANPNDAAKDEARRQQIERLRDELWDYARKHDGKFPAARSEPSISGTVWAVPDPSGLPYLYVGGAISEEAVPVAYEPGLFGAERYVLLSNGDVRRWTLDRILAALPPEKR